MFRQRPSRRTFLKTAAGSTVGFWVAGGVSAAPSKSPNEKLNAACIGIGGRGGALVGGVKRENIVALCDVDERTAGGTSERHPKAKFFADFRRMFDEMHKQIDLVTVGTPDHTHGWPSIAAMQLGKHVYVEKPLAHNVYECYKMAELSRKMNVATQLGNQHHAEWRWHRVAELVKAGVIGRVTEVHFCLKPSNTVFPTQNGPRFLQESGRPKEQPPVPQGLNWDLWLGPAVERPYHPAYCPNINKWLHWQDFGTGEIGSWWCHAVDPAFMALDLQYPISAEAVVVRPVASERIPNPAVRYVYPARGDQPAVTVYWHAGGSGPRPELLDGESGDCLMVGEKGCMLCWHQPGQPDDEPLLLPKAKFADFQRPATKIPPLRSHMDDFLNAIKTGGKSGCDIANYAVYLGVPAVLWQVAFKLGRKIEWDGANMKVPGCPEADPLIRRVYRKGWEL